MSSTTPTTSTKKSKAWEYFQLVEDKEKKSGTKCKVNGCKEGLAYHQSTTAMLKHLESHHPEKHMECTGKTSAQSQQLKITSDDYKMKDLTREKSKQIINAIASFIYQDLKPLKTVESDGFKHLIHTLEPRYQLPVRSTFSDTVIPAHYSAIKMKIIEDLKQSRGFGLAFDYWTSISNKSFLTLTIHFMPMAWKIQDYVLATVEGKDPHTTINTADVISSILDSYQLNDGEHIKFFGITDSAPNMKKDVRELAWPHIQCFAHCLHNSLVEGLETVSEVSQLIMKVKILIKFFRSSPQKSNLLLKMQEKLKVSQLRLKLYVTTRWNSTYDMLQRLMRNQVPIINLALENTLVKGLSLTTQEWEEVNSLIELLALFYNVTVLLSETTRPSISMISPLVFNISTNLLKIRESDLRKVTLLKKAIHQGFVKRAKQYDEVKEILDLSSLLDPRYKDLYFP